MPQQQQRNPLPPWATALVRIGVLYFAFTTLGRFMRPASQSAAAAVDPRTLPTVCTFSGGERMSLHVYLSASEVFNESEAALVWQQRGLTYDWAAGNSRDANVTVPVTPAMLANASVFAHVFLVKGASHPRPGRHTSQAYFTYSMTKYLPRPKVSGKKNLISGDLSEQDRLAKEFNEAAEAAATTTTEGADEDSTWVMHWKPALEVRVLGDMQVTTPASLPPQIRENVPMDMRLGVYWPVLFVNTFWLKQDSFIIVNSTLSSLPLQLHFSPISATKYMLAIQMESQMRQQLALTGGVVESEIDEVKRILMETNPYLLGVTLIVSTLHTIFDFLAFKNDISFWRSRKSMAGLSVKTLLLNAGCQVVIFLYLLDNETSWMIIISSGIGLAIEAWKIGKACIVNVVWRKFRVLPFALPWIRLSDRESYTQSKTKVYDEAAMKYLSYALYPLVALYAVYSLVYESHKSWYSWILGSLTGAVYTFGFIMMTPQLFINYKLKSVAHLPWRALVYKSLNTFIDDLFAFVIKMPTMHRIACFRDDVVFLIYVYQRWLYPVDRTRIESLQWEDAAKDYAEQKEAGTTTTAAAAPTAEERPKVD